MSSKRSSPRSATGRAIIWGLGAHVLKTGLSPVIVDLMERGYVSAIATNGAGIIHDFEIALSGGTSEDVDATLGQGTFGMAEETGTRVESRDHRRRGRGPGTGPVGRQVPARVRARRLRRSAWRRTAWRLQIPLTAHVAIGTDIIHMHPQASGAAIGEASLRDFRYFVTCVSRLEGGVYLNCGSAVVLPEVFLKAVAIARNDGTVARRIDDGQPGFSAALSAADQRRDASDRGERPWLLAHRASRTADSAAGSRPDRSGVGNLRPSGIARP